MKTKIKMKKYFRYVITGSLLLMIENTFAENTMSNIYLGGTVARAQGEVGANEMNQRMADLGFDANAQVFGKNRNAWELFAGYEYSRYLSLEAGYTDLGVVRTRLSGATVDIQNYLKDANQVHPRSASGYELALLGTYPVSEENYIFARGGILAARSRYRADAQTDVAFRNDSGSDLFFGIGAGHKLNEHWDLRLSWENYRVEGENIQRLGLGLIYRFHETRKAPVVVQTIPAPVYTPPVPEVIQPIVPEVPVIKKEVQPVSIRLAIQFETNSYVIKPDYLNEVEKLANFMKENQQAKVSIEGHTDNRGNDDLNKKLSQNRAKAVRDLLVSQYGIADERVTYIGYGKDHPIADNTTESGRASNRRVMAEVSVKP